MIWKYMLFTVIRLFYELSDQRNIQKFGNCFCSVIRVNRWSAGVRRCSVATCGLFACRPCRAYVWLLNAPVNAAETKTPFPSVSCLEGSSKRNLYYSEGKQIVCTRGAANSYKDALRHVFWVNALLQLTWSMLFFWWVSPPEEQSSLNLNNPFNDIYLAVYIIIFKNLRHSCSLDMWRIKTGRKWN